MDNKQRPVSRSSAAQPRGFSFVELCVVFLLIAGLIALLLPAIRRNPAAAAHRVQCANRIRNVGIALANYHHEFGRFPPAWTTDASGRRLHSWRTLILPFLDQQAIYDRIDLLKPWNAAQNLAAQESLPEDIFRCSAVESEDAACQYLAVVDDSSCFPPVGASTLSDITDGTEQTILLVEVPSSEAVNWMRPTDLTLSRFLSIVSRGDFNHPGGFNIVRADGSVSFIRSDCSPDQLRNMVTISGGEDVDDTVY